MTERHDVLAAGCILREIKERVDTIEADGDAPAAKVEAVQWLIEALLLVMKAQQVK